MPIVPIEELPGYWQEYIAQLEATISNMIITQRALIIGLFVASLFILLLLWRYSRRPKMILPRPALPPMHADVAGYIALVNSLIKHPSPGMSNDLKHGIAMFNQEVVLVSTAITIRLAREGEANDLRMREMILEDLDANNGIALKIVETPDIFQVVPMDRAAYKQWRRDNPNPSA